ncbi:glycosyltransferase [bacterium]|jgi:glycosyltransferase involved in cell wall biosynthesis|nr:glycosyltransferase [bacterium]
MNSVKISVVIGTYNQKDKLRRVLDSFFNQTMPAPEYEIIVIDSGSTDGTKELMDSYSPDCGYKPIVQRNEGKSGARNRGVTESNGKYIIITDADMIADKEFVKTHYDAHLETKGTVCFEGVTYNMTDYHWPPDPKKIFPYITGNYPNKKRLGWYYFLTGNISFPKELFLSVNGFDMDFQNYGWEDIEMGYRLFQKNVPLRYLKGAINYHYHVISKEEEVERNVDKGDSARILLRKHPELKWFLGLNPLSTWVFNKIFPEGRVYNQIKDQWSKSTIKLKRNFSFWFLKEYHYLKGILGKK